MDETEEQIVERLLGRKPKGPWSVCLVDQNGEPLVLETAPILEDGTPMPTIYWLIGRELRQEVSRIESRGGVKWADTHLDHRAIMESHERYRQLRESKIVPCYLGIKPYGGVGGTRSGVKCLHAHVAWHLVGGNDPIGRWTLQEIKYCRNEFI
ncbi:MAG: DUF501 domain-containing protein [Acidimicrobiaceae bacterium]|nr:DUF501 domain-containing protein [Acidimicrobiaceae bacterium]